MHCTVHVDDEAGQGVDYDAAAVVVPSPPPYVAPLPSVCHQHIVHPHPPTCTAAGDYRKRRKRRRVERTLGGGGDIDYDAATPSWAPPVLPWLL